MKVAIRSPPVLSKLDLSYDIAADDVIQQTLVGGSGGSLSGASAEAQSVVDQSGETSKRKIEEVGKTSSGMEMPTGEIWKSFATL